MLRVIDCIVAQHDLRILALALILCCFASSTSIIMLQRGIAAPSASMRWSWLCGAGFVTGVGIWATHFAAMLAFAPGVPVGFDPRIAAVSLLVAVTLAMSGWILGFSSDKPRAWTGGVLVGLALTGAHYLDTTGFRFAGRLEFEPAFVAWSIILGLMLCALTARAAEHGKSVSGLIVASGLLVAAITSLHLIGMSAVQLFPDPAIVIPDDVLDMNHIATWVVAAAISILAVGLALAVSDRRVARRMADDHRRLSASLEALKQSQEHYRYSVELNPQIPWTADRDGNIVEVGPRWAEIVGQGVETAFGSAWVSYLHPDDTQPTAETWSSSLKSGTPVDVRYRVRTHEGLYRWFRARARPRVDDAGAIVAWYGTLEDIHDQVLAENALRDREERYRLASRATNDAIWDWHHGSNHIDWGEAVSSHLGYDEATRGTTLAWWADRVHPEDRARVLASLQAAIAGTETNWSSEYRFRKADGTYADILSRGHIVREASGKAVRSIGAMLDISAQKRTEQSLRWAANHDTLTGLPNRALFQARLVEAIARAHREKTSLGLVVLDVDHFKAFNDARGHAAGDDLLCWIARSLLDVQPSDVTVARLGGDEFALIVPNVDEHEPDADGIRAALRGLAKPYVTGGESIEITVSAGAAVWPRDAVDPDELLKAADLALYTAKSDGRGAVRSFRPDMRAAADRRASMLGTARAALREDRIVAFYQPKLSFETGEAVGFEALLRLRSGSGLRGPGDILAAFDDVETSIDITNRMLDRVLDDIRKWQDDGIAFGRVGINGSSADFKRGDFADRILSRLHAANVAPSAIELEVTESVFLGARTEYVDRILGEITAAGITIALDDFGTGYASLSHLAAFPVDVLKIDQSFVRRLSRSCAPQDSAIVDAVISLAKKLGVDTVAEGVETIEQATYLREQGCDFAQGYLFSKPIAPSRLPAFLRKGASGWLHMIDGAVKPQRRRRAS